MGETRLLIKIYGADSKKAVELDAIVDTGAIFTKIPFPIAQELELESRYETEVELVDGRVIKRTLAPAEVEIEGVRRAVLIAIVGGKERPIVGYTTLEALGFKVNPVTSKIEKTVAIEY